MGKNNKTVDRVQAAFNFIGGEDKLDALIQGRATLEFRWIELVNWLGTTTTSATTENFIAKERFRKDSRGVTFDGFSDNFTKWFLAGDGKIEGPLSEQVLRYGNLTKNSPSGLIIEELGGEAKAETALIEMYDQLKKQPKGEEGALLTNGYANIFYIRDVRGVLRAVYVPWFRDGWHVYAFSVGSPSDWRAGRRIFSRNF